MADALKFKDEIEVLVYIFLIHLLITIDIVFFYLNQYNILMQCKFTKSEKNKMEEYINMQLCHKRRKCLRHSASQTF